MLFGGVILEKSSLYVFLNPISNHVLIKNCQLLLDTTIEVPDNILLLNGFDEQAVFDEFTRFYMINGKENVRRFLNRQRLKKQVTVGWLDFKSVQMLHHLLPTEIAEILYLYHAKVPLRSPFYYKLQNQYVYLLENGDTTKIYFRRVNDFYHQFARKLAQRTEAVLYGRANSFPLSMVTSRHQKHIQVPDDSFIQQLSDYFLDGVIFDFSQLTQQKAKQVISLYQVEDHMDTTLKDLNKQKPVLTIHYDRKSKKWTI